MVRFMKGLVAIAVIILALVIPTAVSSAFHFDETKPKCNCYFPNLGKYGVTKGQHCEVVDCEPPKPKPKPKPTP